MRAAVLEQESILQNWERSREGPREFIIMRQQLYWALASELGKRGR
jgi:hypothetical protein